MVSFSFLNRALEKRQSLTSLKFKKHNKEQNVLHLPELWKPFVLKTDASDEGLGATLYQDEKLIGMYSNKLLKAELNYTTTEKKFLAIIKALRLFKSIILLSKINVLSDHELLTF